MMTTTDLMEAADPRGNALIKIQHQQHRQATTKANQLMNQHFHLTHLKEDLKQTTYELKQHQISLRSHLCQGMFTRTRSNGMAKPQDTGKALQ